MMLLKIKKNQEISKVFSSLFLQILMVGWGAVWLQVKRGVIFYSLAAAAVILKKKLPVLSKIVTISMELLRINKTLPLSSVLMPGWKRRTVRSYAAL